MALLAGFGGRITINGVNLKAHHWSIDWKIDDFDVLNFENNGFGMYFPGIQDADISFDAFFDTVDEPFAAPVNITPGASSTIVINYIKGNAAFTWTLPSVLCTNIHAETGVRDMVRYSYTGKVNGYSVPLGLAVAVAITPST